MDLGFLLLLGIGGSVAATAHVFENDDLSLTRQYEQSVGDFLGTQHNIPSDWIRGRGRTEAALVELL